MGTTRHAERARGNVKGHEGKAWAAKQACAPHASCRG